MKNKLALILAVVLGLVAVYGFQKVLQNRQNDFQNKFKPQRIAAAGERITAGTPVLPKMLYKDVDNLPGKIVTESTVTADDIMADDQRFLGQVINKTVERGEPLRWSYFRQPVEKLEQKLNAGERAVTLRVDNVTGVAGNLVPGSRVDVIGTFPTSTQQGAAARAPAAAGAPMTGATASHTVLLLDNVRILAVDSRTHDEEYVISNGARVKSYSTITVAVSPLEANLLVYAQQDGALTMSLRSPVADTNVPEAQDVSDKNLLDLAATARKDRDERLKKQGSLEEFVPQP